LNTVFEEPKHSHRYLKRWNGVSFGSSNAVFNMAPQHEPSKEEIGLSSLESPALSIHLEAVQINGWIFKR